MKLTWKLLKEIVKEMRIKQDRMMKRQGGLNELMVAISITHPVSFKRVHFYPHGINLTTGRTFARIGGVFRGINIKEMLLL